MEDKARIVAAETQLDEAQLVEMQLDEAMNEAAEAAGWVNNTSDEEQWEAEAAPEAEAEVTPTPATDTEETPAPAPPPMTGRTECLTHANLIINGAREAQYGSPEDSFNAIAALWNAYLGAQPPLTSKQVAEMMILLKVARSSSGEAKLDNYVDIAGYAACAYEIVRDIYGAE